MHSRVKWHKNLEVVSFLVYKCCVCLYCKTQSCNNCLAELYCLCIQIQCLRDEKEIACSPRVLGAQEENNLDRFVCATSWQSLLHLNPTANWELLQVNKKSATSSRLIDPHIKIHLIFALIDLDFSDSATHNCYTSAKSLCYGKPYEEDFVKLEKSHSQLEDSRG